MVDPEVSRQEITGLLYKLSTAKRVLAIYFDIALTIGCSVAGKLKLLLPGGFFSVQNEGDCSITESPGLNASIETLLWFFRACSVIPERSKVPRFRSSFRRRSYLISV